MESRSYFSTERGVRHFSQMQSVEQFRNRFGQDPNLVKKYTLELANTGYAIIPDVLSKNDINTLLQECNPIWEAIPGGKTNFHGFTTKRIQGVPSKIFSCPIVLEHPLVLSIIDQFLPKNYLISNIQAIKTAPGETAQPFHYDAALFPIHKRGGEEINLVAVCALSDFTKHNGATRVIPGSHRWKDTSSVPDHIPVEYLEMKRGGIAIWLGNLYHSAGANQSDDFRYALLSAYSNPYLRTLENFSLSVDRELVKKYSPVMQSMLGYSIVPPYIGSVDSRSPTFLLEQ